MLTDTVHGTVEAGPAHCVRRRRGNLGRECYVQLLPLHNLYAQKVAWRETAGGMRERDRGEKKIDDIYVYFHGAKTTDVMPL